MESLFQTSAREEIASRINALSPETTCKWGKMNVAQMLAHCGNVMEVAIADAKPPLTLIGRFMGPFIKHFLYNENPFPKNSPTAPDFKIVDKRDFNTEKARLLSLVNRFHELGTENLPKHKHPYFGTLSNKQWGMASYKHISYHLNQFGV